LSRPVSAIHEFAWCTKDAAARDEPEHDDGKTLYFIVFGSLPLISAIARRRAGPGDFAAIGATGSAKEAVAIDDRASHRR
jgi:hypothetical protein